MALEFFRKEGRGFIPKASVRRGGQIGFNQAAIRKFNLTDGQNVLLGYDKDCKMVVIQRIGEPEQGAKKITIREKSGAISAKGFLDYFEIPREESRSYHLEEDVENNYLKFFLEDETSQIRSD